MMLLACLAALCVAACALWLRFAGRGNGLPWRLRGAELVYSERVFAGGIDGVQLSARVDRAYRLASGDFVLAELKTRSAAVAYLSDVIELSAQRLVMAVATGERVQSRGYVVVQSSDSTQRRWLRVRLLPREVLLGLAHRRHALTEASQLPAFTASPGLCERCRHRALCDGAQPASSCR